ncbi:MAG TPA: hypothetical protein VLI54_02575 [Bacillota bacterium]|nr:hypothetical protein [Bacillota bacterium]
MPDSPFGPNNPFGTPFGAALPPPPMYNRHPEARRPDVSVEGFSWVPEEENGPQVPEARIFRDYLGPTQVRLAEDIVTLVQAANDGRLPADWSVMAGGRVDGLQASMLQRRFPDGPATDVGQAAQELVVAHDMVSEDLTHVRAAEAGRVAKREYLAEVISNDSRYLDGTIDVGQASALRDESEPAAARAGALERLRIEALPESERRGVIGIDNQEDRIVANFDRVFMEVEKDKIEELVKDEYMLPYERDLGAKGIIEAYQRALEDVEGEAERSMRNRTAADAERRRTLVTNQLQRITELYDRYIVGREYEVVAQTLNRLATRVDEIRTSGIAPVMPDRPAQPVPTVVPSPAPGGFDPDITPAFGFGPVLPVASRPHTAAAGAPGPGGSPRTGGDAEYGRGPATPYFDNIRLQLAFEVTASDRERQVLAALASGDPPAAINPATVRLNEAARQLIDNGVDAGALARRLGIDEAEMVGVFQDLQDSIGLAFVRQGDTLVYAALPQQYELVYMEHNGQLDVEDNFFHACAGPAFEMMSQTYGTLSLKDMFARLSVSPEVRDLPQAARNQLVADLIDHMVTTGMVQMRPGERGEGTMLFMPGWSAYGEGLQRNRVPLLEHLTQVDGAAGVDALVTIDQAHQDLLLALGARGGRGNTQQLHALLTSWGEAYLAQTLDGMVVRDDIYDEGNGEYVLHAVTADPDDEPMSREALLQLVPDVRATVMQEVRRTGGAFLNVVYQSGLNSMVSRADSLEEAHQIVRTAIAGLRTDGVLTVDIAADGGLSGTSMLRANERAGGSTHSDVPAVQALLDRLGDQRYRDIVIDLSTRTAPFTIEDVERSLPPELASNAAGIAGLMARQALLLEDPPGTYTNLITARPAQSAAAPAAGPPPEVQPNEPHKYLDQAREFFGQGGEISAQSLSNEFAISMDEAQLLMEQLEQTKRIFPDGSGGYVPGWGFTK